MNLLLPVKWSHWTILEELGSGSYGTVYKAKNNKGEISAIKVIDIPRTLKEGESVSREYNSEKLAKEYYNDIVTEFEKEIQIMISLRECSNIVKIYDYHKEPRGVGFRVYIQMECLENFSDYCAREEIDEKRVIHFAIDLSKALEQCHKMNIIHRDIKPGNILVASDGTLKLCDFGLARRLETHSESLSMKGTFTYMAPEIFLGKTYNEQVDIYSLGIILYRLMNHNREPFLPLDKKLIYYRDKEEAFHRRNAGEEIPAPVDASPEFANLILKALAFDLKERYVSATAMRKDLEKILGGSYKTSWLPKMSKKKLEVGLAMLACIAVLAFVGVWRYLSQEVHTSYSNGLLKVWGHGTVSASEVDRYRERDVHKLVIGDGITEIGDYAFTDFSSLTEIEFSDSVESIGDHAFAGCSSLEGSLDLKEMDGLASYAFYGCESINQVRLPDEQMEVPDDCFCECRDLTEVFLGVKTNTFGTEAFEDCESLGSFDKLEQIEMFEDGALLNTKWLNDRINAGETWITSGDFLIYYNGNDAVVTIPENVTKIGPNAFQENESGKTALRKVYIHGGVTMIGNDAFHDCQSLSEVIFEDADSVSIGSHAFDGTAWYESLKTEEKN